MNKEEKSKKVLLAEQKLAQAKAQLERAKREEKEKIRVEQNRHKYMMGGCVAKYFPECWNFSELEMNRIVACAFKNRDVLNMIDVVVSERPAKVNENEESEVTKHADEGVGN